MGMCGHHRWLLLVLWLSAGPAQALEAVQDSSWLERHFVQKHWGLEDGLPQSTVMDITQDDQGYLWLATFGGLVRFNGREMRSLGVSNTSGLERQRSVSLATHRGTLWVGFQSGAVARLRDGVFQTFGQDRESYGFVRALHPLPDGTLLIGTSRGLFRMSEAGEYEHLLARDLPSATSITARPGSAPWIGSEAGIWALQGDTFQKMPRPDPDAKAGVSMLEHLDESWWIGQGDLFRKDGDLPLGWSTPSTPR